MLKKIIKRTTIAILSLFILICLALFIYTLNAYKPSDLMEEELNKILINQIEVDESFDHITYSMSEPTKNIVIIPGGKVYANSYSYIAYNLALEGYQVTIFKSFFKLAILTPNYASGFLENDMDNILIGHSLGGTVASMIAYDNEDVTDIIFLASYPIKNMSDKNVLLMTATNDQILDQQNVEDSKTLLPSDTVFKEIIGGNHGYFGFYGNQKNDGRATISNLEQQQIVIAEVIKFIQ